MGEANNPLTAELCQTFVELHQHEGSVKPTAQALGLSESSVSKRLRPLLNGSPPFVPRPWLAKDGKRYRLTPEGQRMLQLATEVAGRWRQLATHARANEQPGIAIACGQEAAGDIVLKAAKVCRRKHPDVRFRIAVVRGRHRIEGLLQGLYDIALLTFSKPRIEELAGRAVTIDRLHEDELGLACLSGSPWTAAFRKTEQPVTLEELSQWPLVLPEANSAIRSQFDDRLHRHAAGASPRIALEVGGWRVLLGYVLAGFGVGLLPKSVALATQGEALWRPLTSALRPSNHVFAVRRVADGSEPLKSFVAALT